MTRRMKQPRKDELRQQLAAAAEEIIQLRAQLPKPGEVMVVPTFDSGTPMWAPAACLIAGFLLGAWLL